MATYNGIFERSSLGQTNIVPRQGPMYTSPDIIPFGIGCVSDPQNFFKSNYDADEGRPLEAGKTNYIYLRGKNYSNQKIDDSGENRPRLFWAKASLLSYPSTWTELTRSPDRRPFSLAADAGSIGVVNQPFIWCPQDISNDHYCLIAQVQSPGYDNSIPDTMQISDFAGWVANHGGIAWRSVDLINSTSLTITNEGMFYDEGDMAAVIQFTIKCMNVPVGTKVSFSAGAPGPVPAIFLPPVTVTSLNFITGIQCQVPAYYVSSIYYNLELPPGIVDISTATVTLQAAYVAA